MSSDTSFTVRAVIQVMINNDDDNNDDDDDNDDDDTPALPQHPDPGHGPARQGPAHLL